MNLRIPWSRPLRGRGDAEIGVTDPVYKEDVKKSGTGVHNTLK